MGLGFRALKGVGWQRQRMRRTDPEWTYVLPSKALVINALPDPLAGAGCRTFVCRLP